MDIKIRRMLSKRLSQIKQRCENENIFEYYRYGAVGIKNFLTLNDLIFLWERDQADKLKFPSIDRVDVKGNYSLENCRFIERSENTARKRMSIHDPIEKPCRLCGTPFPGVWINKYCSTKCRIKYNGGHRMIDGRIIYTKRG